MKKNPGPGRPVSTNSAANPIIRFRVSDEQLADLKQKGANRGLTANLEAKRRAFPSLPQKGG